MEAMRERYTPPWNAIRWIEVSFTKYPSDARRDCTGFANHYNINNLVCVVQAYTTLGVAIGVVFFWCCTWVIFGLSNNTAYVYI